MLLFQELARLDVSCQMVKPPKKELEPVGLRSRNFFTKNSKVILSQTAYTKALAAMNKNH